MATGFIFTPTAHTLPVVVPAPKVGAVRPLPRASRARLVGITGDRTLELLATSFVGKFRVSITVFDRKPTFSFVGKKVTAVDEHVWVVDTDRRSCLRLLHDQVLVVEPLHFVVGLMNTKSKSAAST